MSVEAKVLSPSLAPLAGGGLRPLGPRLLNFLSVVPNNNRSR